MFSEEDIVARIVDGRVYFYIVVRTNSNYVSLLDKEGKLTKVSVKDTLAYVDPVFLDDDILDDFQDKFDNYEEPLVVGTFVVCKKTGIVGKVTRNDTRFHVLFPGEGVSACQSEEKFTKINPEHVKPDLFDKTPEYVRINSVIDKDAPDAPHWDPKMDFTLNKFGKVLSPCVGPHLFYMKVEGEYRTWVYHESWFVRIKQEDVPPKVLTELEKS